MNIFRKVLLSAILLLFGAGFAKAQDTISLVCSEDFYLVDAQFSLTIDGASVTPGTACTARNPAPNSPTGSSQIIPFNGSWGGTATAHQIAIKFLNDAWGGTSATDRNLYVWSLSFDGTPAPGVATGFAYFSNGKLFLRGASDGGLYTTVIVAQPPPSITTQPVSKTINNGAAAVFTVVASKATKYQWRKNGAAIVGASAASYTTPAATSMDSGAKFDVVVSNATGSITSSQASLSVVTVAKLDAGASTFTTTMPGVDALMNCTTVACVSSIVAGGSGSASTILTLTVTGTGTPLSITTTTLPAGTVGSLYSAQLAASGGVAPYTWSITTGALPAGLVVNGAGVISGTPTSAASTSFTVMVKDSSGLMARKSFGRKR